jgi:hypothetical protein
MQTIAEWVAYKRKRASRDGIPSRSHYPRKPSSYTRGINRARIAEICDAIVEPENTLWHPPQILPAAPKHWRDRR